MIVKKTILSALLLFFLLSVFTIFIYENSYEMTETTAVIPTTQGELAAVITLPNNTKVKGIVILVHGDGAVNATYEGGYKPMMEQFAKAGFATVSWDKPGVGHSTGNWLHQSMDDRAEEVIEVTQWVMAQPTLNSSNLVLWGASQAGWVIPKVLAKHILPVTKTILVAPAINWIEQGRYYTRAALKKHNKSATEINLVLEKNKQILALLKADKPYADYLQITGAGANQLMSEDRWLFVKKNVLADATEDLTQITIPIDLILAGQDRNVDSDNTLHVYSATVPKSLLNVTIIANADHSMISPVMAKSPLLTALIAIIAPKDLLLDRHYLNKCYQSVNAIIH